MAVTAAVATGMGWAALPAPAGAVTVPDPVLRYTFDDLTSGATLAAGASIADTGVRTTRTDGTVVGSAATAVAGVTGAANDAALNLPGGTSASPGAYVTLPNDIISTSDTAVTVTAWTKWAGPANGNCQWPFALGKSQTSNLFATTSCNGTYGGVTDSGEQRVGNGGANLPTNVWTQIALVYNVSAGTISYYVDGVLDQVAGATGNGLGTITGLTKTINAAIGTGSIGGQLGKSFYSPDPYYGGALDDVEVFNQALTQDQIEQAGADDFSAIVDADTVSLGDTSAVTGNLALPATGTHGSAISWASSNTAVVSNTGTVTRPAVGSGNVTLTLTPTYSLGGQTRVGDPISVTVLAKTSDAEVIPTDGLIASYDFSDTSGTTLTNAAATGSADNGTVQGTPAWHDGVMDFTGSNYVKLPDNLLSGKTAASVTVEARPSATSLSGNNFLWNLGGTGNTAANSGTGQFFVQTNGHRASISKTNYSAERTALDPNPFVADQWQSITTTIAPNGDGTTSTLTLYVDGTQVGQTTTSDTGIADLVTQTNDLIGASAYSGDAKFTGAISSFRLYDRALTSGEVTTVSDLDAATAAQEAVAGIDLGDLSAVAADLSLPTNGGITWATSNAAVIGADGTIHPIATAQTATLTATATVGGHTATRTFDVTVAPERTPTQKAQFDLAQISIPDADDIRGNITLPDTGTAYGSAITWSASPAGIISTTADGAEAAGVVSRPAKDTVVTLTAAVAGTSATRAIQVTVKAAPTPHADASGYLFAHFTVNQSPKTNDEQIYFASSQDGVQWTDLNNLKPVLTSTVGEKGARDPYLIRSPEGDKYYLIATDLSSETLGWRFTPTNPGSTSLVVWESDDLEHWSAPRLVDVASQIPDAGCAWAPEAMWDPNTGQYMVYWASTTDGSASDPLGNANGDQMNMYYATTRDFVNFSKPHKWIDRTNSVIDTTMIKAGDWYYRASGDGEITIERTKNPYATTGDVQTTSDADQWSYVGTLHSIFNNSGYTGSQLEGPEFFEYNKADWEKDASGNPVPTWGLMADQYASGKGYLPFRTTDLDSTSSTADGGAWSLGSDINFGTLLKRHGTILPLGQDEYDSVQQAYGSASTKTASIAVTQAPSKTGYTKGESLDTTGLAVTATMQDGSTKVLSAGEYAVSGYDPSTTGTQQVSIAYRADPTITTTFSVTVSAPKELQPGTPTVGGRPVVGSTLTATPGTWGPGTVTLSYQWYRGGTAIPGATGVSYRLTGADYGQQMRVQVTGTESGYPAATASSAPTAAVAAGTLSGHKPKIKGKARVGRKLKAKAGSWGPGPVTLSYQWYRNGKLVKGATKAAYKLKHADRGKKLTVRVSATEPGYTTVTVKSKASRVK